MKTIARISTLVLLLSGTALGAIHHMPAQAAYFDAHKQCVKHLRDAKNDAASKDATEQKRVIEAAKREYRRCEAHAHLIWKYYPASPPPDAAPGRTSTQ